MAKKVISLLTQLPVKFAYCTWYHILLHSGQFDLATTMYKALLSEYSSLTRCYLLVNTLIKYSYTSSLDTIIYHNYDYYITHLSGHQLWWFLLELVGDGGDGGDVVTQVSLAVITNVK